MTDAASGISGGNDPCEVGRGETEVLHDAE